MIAMPIRRSPHNPITQTLDRLIQAERVEAEQLAARAVRRKALVDGTIPAGEADQAPLPPNLEPSPL